MQKEISQDAADTNGDLADRLILAVGHPVRRRVLEALMQEPASATTLSKWLVMPLGNVAYHLCEVLGKQCDAVAVIERHKRRGALEKVYAINPSSHVNAIQWPVIPEPVRSGARGLSLASFVRVVIAALEAESTKPRDDSLFAWRSVQVDEQGQRETREAIEMLAEKLKAVEARCTHLSPSSLFPLIVGMAAFESAPRSQEKTG